MTESEQMEELVWKRRRDKFAEEGLNVDDAGILAGHMMLRDRENHAAGRELDNRRVCFECQHLENFKHCNAYKDYQGRPVPQLRFTLQRCPKFELKGKK